MVPHALMVPRALVPPRALPPFSTSLPRRAFLHYQRAARSITSLALWRKAHTVTADDGSGFDFLFHRICHAPHHHATKVAEAVAAARR